MRKTISTVLSALLIAALTTQAMAASKHHHMRTMDRATARAAIRNTNAYLPPSNVPVQPSWSGYDEAVGSGPAGH